MTNEGKELEVWFFILSDMKMNSSHSQLALVLCILVWFCGWVLCLPFLHLQSQLWKIEKQWNMRRVILQQAIPLLGWMWTNNQKCQAKFWPLASMPISFCSLLFMLQINLCNWAKVPVPLYHDLIHKDLHMIHPIHVTFKLNNYDEYKEAHLDELMRDKNSFSLEADLCL